MNQERRERAALRRQKRQRAKGKRRTMPRATVSMKPTKFDLETCPEGWVELRRMSYGELLASQDMAYQINVQMQSQNGSAEPEMGAKMSQASVLEYQFKLCIVNHNLENEAGQPLDFRQASAVHLLDPLIGQEINSLVEKLHRWDKTYPNSETLSGSASSTNGAAEMASTPKQVLVLPPEERVPPATSPTS